MTQAASEDLFALGRKATHAIEALYAEAVASLRGKVVENGKLSNALIEKEQHAAHGLAWLFPQLAGVRFEHAWSGPMDMTKSGLPSFFTLPGGNVHAGLGFSGHGLSATKGGGKILASFVLEHDDEWVHLPVVGPPTLLPPEPLRWPMHLHGNREQSVLA